jgi:hypothetical protein
LKKSHLHSFLSQLQLENKAVFRNKDKAPHYDFGEGITGDIRQRIESIEPDAIYIFNSQPLILFFDLTDKEKKIDELYKKVWSFDNTSIIFLIKDKDIEVFNALNYIKENDLNTLEKINLSKQEIQELFNIWELESGKTWEWFQNNFIDQNKGKTHKRRVNERLFSNIKEVREGLKKKGLVESEANSLILRLIFIRYLIDRKIKIDDKLIPGKINNLNERRKSFIQLIREPEKLNQLFEILNIRFNGVLFKENEILLTESQAEYLSGVFEGELVGNDSLFEGFFFDIFDFSIIPVEVISGIYESLIDEEKRKLDSAVYTPSFLVDYILNDTVDEFLKHSSPQDCIVFEVAVGSGIFLVQSLRRIIEKEIETVGKKNKNAFAKRIKGFAENNLFGIDINEQALTVTCFSIYIALLDYLEPADINKYKFPELIGRNLFKANFFDTEHHFNKVIKQAQPKFILGNPPWKKDRSKEHLHWVNTTETYTKTIKGNLEIAQSFLLRTKEFMQKDTTCSLVVTSTVFYNISSTAKQFKKDFLTSFILNKFLDLSPVRRLIFEKKNSPATVVTYQLSQNSNYNKNIVKHQSIKSNIFLKNFKILVIEKFDQKEIKQRHFIDNDWMFKVALYGNTLDYYFLKRILLNDNILFNHIDDKTIYGGAGFHKGKKGVHKSFPELINRQLIENGEVEKYYSVSNNPDNVLTKANSFIKSGGKRELYTGRQILIKEQAKNESEVVVSLTDQEYIFHSGVFSITSPIKKDFIESLYGYLISDLYTYYIYMNSGSWGTSTRPQIRWKEEYLSFPLEILDDERQQLLLEHVNDFIKPLEKFQEDRSIESHSKFQLSPSFDFEAPNLPLNNNALNQINEIINEVYQVNEQEKDLIDYVLNVSRYQFQESKQDKFTQKVDDQKDFLKKYAEVYIKQFAKIYSDEFIQVEIFPLKHFIAMNFLMVEKEPRESIIYSKHKKASSVLKTLANTLSISQIVSTSEPSKNLFIQKDIKGFEENSFYVIKPNEYKCWHRAMAWYDVAEFKEAIQRAEMDENLSAE